MLQPLLWFHVAVDVCPSVLLSVLSLLTKTFQFHVVLWIHQWTSAAGLCLIAVRGYAEKCVTTTTFLAWKAHAVTVTTNSEVRILPVVSHISPSSCTACNDIGNNAAWSPNSAKKGKREPCDFKTWGLSNKLSDLVRFQRKRWKCAAGPSCSDPAPQRLSAAGIAGSGEGPCT